MKQRPFHALILGVFCCLAFFCTRPWAGDPSSAPVHAVVTTSLIETALRDLLDEQVVIDRLLPAGSCPGHFDLGPEHIETLARADIFVRHDFQSDWDKMAERAGVPPEKIISVTSLPAFTIPFQYVLMCTELATNLLGRRPDLDTLLSQNLESIKAWAERAERESRDKAATLRGRKVLAAHYQRDFCEWLGLTVVASYHAGTDESAWQLNRAVEMGRLAGAEAVVGNLQWGPKHLAALSEAAKLPGIMLSNFPKDGMRGAYARLLDENISAILRGFHAGD